ncbi:hypothetical protein QV08_12190 [Gallibacterium salpingitidis]|uniref:heme/hemin ABC transporter substrate-binding protein n=1 Tax=Gallibacterium salpingitidis TaxID=505341 RepID=UPI000804C685|nr:ABC transporter substrate-binding protein [Gallibacterium salpingitidis]OBX04877.1 hypothetical protein QV08_12190 [Gallibacterium salpingitidis]
MLQRTSLVISIVFSLLLSISASAKQNTQKVITIGSGITELVITLGSEKQIIATDSTSRHFAEQYGLPILGYQRNLNTENILALQPTTIIGTDEMGPKVVLEQLKQSGINIIQLSNTQYNFSDLLDNTKLIGETLGKSIETEQLIKSMQTSYHKIQQLKLPSLNTLFLFFPSNNQIMAGGSKTVVDGMLQALNLKNIAANKSGYYAYSIEHILQSQPKVLLVSARELTQNLDKILQDNPFLQQLEATKKQCVFTIDGQALLGGFNLKSLQESQRIAQLLANKPECLTD